MSLQVHEFQDLNEAVSQLRLRPREAQAWLFPLASLELPQDLSFLDESEKERAGNILSPERHDQFVKSRLAVKTFLSKLLNLDLDRIDFQIGPEGRPQLLNASIDFNISHCHDSLLIGMGDFVRIGVDIEPLSPRKNWLAIARKIATDSEYQSLERLEATELEIPPPAFFELWSLKESVLKANGGGVFKNALEVEFVRESMGWKLFRTPKEFMTASQTQTHCEIRRGNLLAAAWFNR